MSVAIDKDVRGVVDKKTFDAEYTFGGSSDRTRPPDDPSCLLITLIVG